MKAICLRLFVNGPRLLACLQEEKGQDLVEYAAVISLIVLGITAGMTTLANGINDTMSSVGSHINEVIG